MIFCILHPSNWINDPFCHELTYCTDDQDETSPAFGVIFPSRLASTNECHSPSRERCVVDSRLDAVVMPPNDAEGEGHSPCRNDNQVVFRSSVGVDVDFRTRWLHSNAWEVPLTEARSRDPRRDRSRGCTQVGVVMVVDTLRTPMYCIAVSTGKVDCTTSRRTYASF